MHAQKRELEELRIKLRLLEARRAEDQERIKSLEKKASEGDQLAAIRAKLQVKFQEQQAALVNSQRLARDLQSENAHLETRAQDAMDQLEMATLDREVAEEKAEAAESELERLNEKLQELELEVAVLKEENEEYEKPIAGVDGERSSLAYVQLEKHNERLKEALIRLRDVSTDAEKEHRSKIHDLERELGAQEDLASRLEMAEAKLSNSEEQVEDLKQQLDDALGAEDLLEELTERNLQMGERIEEMRVTIEDLEALKELADELEENHLETERQLEEEVDMLTLKLRQEDARSMDLEAVVVDMESTIHQFRELVASLQSEIDSLRAQQASQDHETATASKESQALLNLNLKLQSSAVKTQSKTIDLELKKLEAAQLTEHLRIVQLYLPDPYLETEVDSTTALLFFYRVAAKVDMLVNVISNLHGLPNALQNISSDVLVGVCELRGKLRSFGMLNRRFAAVMRRAEPDVYVNLGKVMSELVGVEPKVDGWVAMVKADDFNEGDCARELDSLLSQFSHLAEVMFNHPSLEASEQQLALAYSLEDDLDNFAAAIGFVGHSVQSLVKEGDHDIDVGESSLEESVFEPVQRLLSQVRGVKTPAGKLVAVLEEAVAAQYALLPEFTTSLVGLQSAVADAVDMAVQLAQRIGAHIASIRLSKEPLRLTDFVTFLTEVTGQSDTSPWDVISSLVTRLGSELGDNLPKFRNAAKAGQTVSRGYCNRAEADVQLTFLRPGLLASQRSRRLPLSMSRLSARSHAYPKSSKTWHARSSCATLISRKQESRSRLLSGDWKDPRSKPTRSLTWRMNSPRARSRRRCTRTLSSSFKLSLMQQRLKLRASSAAYPRVRAKVERFHFPAPMQAPPMPHSSRSRSKHFVLRSAFSVPRTLCSRARIYTPTSKPFRHFALSPPHQRCQNWSPAETTRTQRVMVRLPPNASSSPTRTHAMRSIQSRKSCSATLLALQLDRRSLISQVLGRTDQHGGVERTRPRCRHGELRVSEDSSSRA